MKNAAHILYYLSILIYISANTTVIFYAFPAYKTFKRPAFLLWTFGSALGIFVTVFDWTLGKNRDTAFGFYTYYSLRELAFFAAVLLATSGTLLFIKEYCASHLYKSKGTEQDAAANP